MSYLYWNDFVNVWKKLPVQVYSNLSPLKSFTHFGGWENPNGYPLMNSAQLNDFSLLHLPEPWWGNDGTSPLNSVVVNYNPGAAGPNKHYGSALVQNLFGYSDYSSFVNSESIGLTNHFMPTNRWHQAKRAKRVFNTLQRLGKLPLGGNQLKNHLSIELIPWHTTDVKEVFEYIKSNLQSVFTNNLLFAADQSRRIANNTLRNKVIVRLGGQATLDVLNNMVKSGICHYIPLILSTYTLAGPAVISNGDFVKGGGGYFKFLIHEIPDIEFVSIWDKDRQGNDFPPNGDMDWIFQNVI